MEVRMCEFVYVFGVLNFHSKYRNATYEKECL